jgi:hypothetical protein
MSDTTNVIDMTVAGTRSWYPDKWASMTKYRLEVSTYPR